MIDPITQSLIMQALSEDLGETGDVTSASVFGPEEKAAAVIKVRENGVLSGIQMVREIYSRIDKELEIDLRKSDGDSLCQEDVVCRIKGRIRSMLAGERTVLNFLQRLCGVATLTSEFVKKTKGTQSRILDTRKTTPGWRALEKQAVVSGGGVNHRFGMYDMILIKDTHVKAAGGPEKAVRRAREYTINNGLDIMIECEVQSVSEFRTVMEEKPHRIMLDNMSCEEMRECVKLRRKSGIELEASGNINLERIPEVAETGVDYISSGALTHSAGALDIHLVIV